MLLVAIDRPEPEWLGSGDGWPVQRVYVRKGGGETRARLLSFYFGAVRPSVPRLAPELAGTTTRSRDRRVYSAAGLPLGGGERSSRFVVFRGDSKEGQEQKGKKETGVGALRVRRARLPVGGHQDRI